LGSAEGTGEVGARRRLRQRLPRQKIFFRFNSATVMSCRISSMARDADYYSDLVNRLFCGQNARYGPFAIAGKLEIVAPRLIIRVPVHREGDHSDAYELSLFDHIAGLAGELWEHEVRSLLKLEALDHPALPKIVSGGWDEQEGIAFSVTDIGGAPVDADATIEWARENPIAAFEQFSMLLDALSDLHAMHIIHRNLTVDALRAERDNGTTTFRLSGFELSTLVGNILRQVTRHRDDASRTIVQNLYLRPRGGMDMARHLAYLAPEICDFLLGATSNSRNNWETTDVFGLGVIGWEWFCGGIPDVLPAEYAAVQVAVEAEAWTEGRQALTALHEAMRAQLTRNYDIPRPLADVLRSMLDSAPTGRDTSFQLCKQIGSNWEGIRGVWESEKNPKPYLLAYIPEDMIKTVYEARQWVSRSPEDAAGRDELRLFLEREFRQAELVRSPTGALGYASGLDEDLQEAEWVLVGEQAVWFCAFYYQPEAFNNRARRKYSNDILVIKYLKDKDSAGELAGQRPRRRVGRLDLTSFNASQNIAGNGAGRPEWLELTRSLEQSRHQDPENVKFLQSMDFLLDYQQTEQEARQYPFVRVDAPDESGIAAIAVNRSQDDWWVHRSPMLTAYAAAAGLRLPFGDFLGQPEGDEEIVKVELQEGRRPFFGAGRLSGTVTARLDEDTIKVKMDRGARIPAVGWVRRASDSGTRAQLNRQYRGRSALEREPGLIRNLREPLSLDLGRGAWTKRVREQSDLKGDAPQRISDMLSYHPIYALQGPPGSGKTTVAAHAVRAFLDLEQSSRVLVSAQSNYALDNLAARLIAELPRDVLKLRIQSENGRPPEPPVDKHTLGELTKAVAGDARRNVRALVRGGSLNTREKALAGEWLAALDSAQIELGDRISAGASVVFATCSMAATLYDEASQTGRSFDWVIVEEAAKAWPTEIVVPLVLGSRWTLIGDHKQLGAFRSEDVGRFLGSLATMSDENLVQHYKARGERLDRLALFRELFNENHGQRAVSGHLHAVNRLTWQFRMHQDIAEPVGRAFYQAEPLEFDADRLPVSFLKTYHTASKPHGVVHPGFLAGRPLVWIDTTGVSGFEDKRYWSNEGEVSLISDLIQRMDPPSAAADAGDDADDGLVVLTPYRAQVALLGQMGELRGRVHTVHSFQGREAERVVVSLVRTQQRGTTPMANVGHVGTDEVVNVLLSRARRLCVLVGSFGHFAANGGRSWDTVTRAVARYGKIVPVKETDLL
jgi:serine/threonine protein kinase